MPSAAHSIPEQAIKQLLDYYSLKGENFRETPERVARFYRMLTKQEAPNLKTFPLRGKPGMILIKNHVCWSLCPHHLLPVKYTFKIGYIPSKRVFGLSKPARIADYVCSKLMLQEEMPYEVVHTMEEALDTKGCGCIIHGEHSCMQMRGVKSTCVSATSSFMSGVFLISEATRQEFIQL